MHSTITSEYYLLSSLIVVFSSLVMDGVTSTTDANPIGLNRVFKDCTEQELLHYGDSHPGLYSSMTCETVPGIQFTVPMVSRSNSSEHPKRLPRDANPIYKLVPTYHDVVGVHFKNIYYLYDNYIPTPAMDRNSYFTFAYLMPWRIVVSRHCFLHTMEQVKHKAYTELLNLLTTSDDCIPAFLPPRMTQSRNKTSHFYQNLYSQCLDSDNITSVQIVQNVCRLCIWLFNETVPACEIWTKSNDVYVDETALYTNVVLQISGKEEAADFRAFEKWISRGYYLKNCNDGYLGHGRSCFPPVEYVDGVVTQMWIKHSIPDELASREAILSQFSEFILGTTEKMILRFVEDTKSNEEYLDNCVSLKIVLVTTVYVLVDDISDDVINSVKILLDQGKVGINYQNTSYVVYINNNHVPCLRKGNRDTTTLTSREQNMTTYVFIFFGVALFATFAIVLLSSGLKYIQGRYLLRSTQ